MLYLCWSRSPSSPFSPLRFTPKSRRGVLDSIGLTQHQWRRLPASTGLRGLPPLTMGPRTKRPPCRGPDRRRLPAARTTHLQQCRADPPTPARMSLAARKCRSRAAAPSLASTKSPVPAGAAESGSGSFGTSSLTPGWNQLVFAPQRSQQNSSRTSNKCLFALTRTLLVQIKGTHLPYALGANGQTSEWPLSCC